MGDPSKRAFTYFVLTGGRFIYASGLRLAVLKFILSMTVRPPCASCLLSHFVASKQYQGLDAS